MGNSSDLSNDIITIHKSLTNTINSILTNAITLSTTSRKLVSFVQKIEERFQELVQKEKELEEREEKLEYRSKALDEKEKKEEKANNQIQTSFNIESNIQANNYFENQINFEEKDLSYSLSQLNEAVPHMAHVPLSPRSHVQVPPSPLFNAQVPPSPRFHAQVPPSPPFNAQVPPSPRFHAQVPPSPHLPMVHVPSSPRLPMAHVPPSPSFRDQFPSSILPSPVHLWLPNRNFNLLYKATRDEFHDNNFHRMCDFKGATITIIESDKGFLFGGYAPVEWGIENQISKAKRDSTNPNFFLFTLTNPHNIPPTQYFLKYTNDVEAHWSNGFHVCFGKGPDIQVTWNNAHLEDNSWSLFGMTGCSYKDTTGKGPKTFTGSAQFIVKEIEVYLVM